MYQVLGRCAAVVCASSFVGTIARATEPRHGGDVLAGGSSLALSAAALQNKQKPAAQPMAKPMESEKTTIKTTERKVVEESWEIDGDIFLRSADPEPPGVLVMKNIFGWEHSKKSDEDSGGLFGKEKEDEKRDQYEYEIEFEYGLMENHELIFEVPFDVGEGHVDGNGDATIGWHWRFWEEDGTWPAFAIRQFVRIPTGVDSDGVDYELRGLFTKTIVPGSTRLHFNPFGKSVNGTNEEDAKPFQYGAAVGLDHRINENLLFVMDYKYSSREEDGQAGDNHEAQFDLDWKLDNRQTLCFMALASVDGDDDGPQFGGAISYIWSFGE